jgi:hypothetical protein
MFIYIVENLGCVTVAHSILYSHMVSHQKRHLSPHYRAQRLLASAQKMAKKYNLPFDLDVEWIEKKLVAGKCDVSGIPFSFTSLRTGKGGVGSQNPCSPTLDRVLAKKGFVKSNVKVVIWMYHAGKQNVSHETFMQLCRALVRKELNSDRDGRTISSTPAVA